MPRGLAPCSKACSSFPRAGHIQLPLASALPGAGLGPLAIGSTTGEAVTVVLEGGGTTVEPAPGLDATAVASVFTAGDATLWSAAGLTGVPRNCSSACSE